VEDFLEEIEPRLFMNVGCRKPSLVFAPLGALRATNSAPGRIVESHHPLQLQMSFKIMLRVWLSLGNQRAWIDERY